MADIQVGRSRRAFGFLAAVGASIALGSCSGGGGGTSNVGTSPVSHPQLTKVEFGRLVDVYGYQRTDQGLSFALYLKDVVVGPDIQDERDTNSTKRDDEILYDFLSANPDTLQPRLFIPREIGTDAFQAAFDRVDDQLRQVTPMAFGQGSAGRPYSVVPRNAAIRLSFSQSIGIDDNFFVVRNDLGRVIGLRNTEAVQLLEMAGDPSSANAFHVLPARFIPIGNTLVIDPVLLGTEGIDYQARNNAAGLPESPDLSGANIRIAIELEGGQAIPGLREDTVGGLNGLNNAGRRSIIRDFRSGNTADNSADVAQGFVRDPIPPRVLGEMVMYVERIDPVNAFVQEVTIYKNGVNHEIDRGDVLKFVNDNSGTPVAVSEVLADPDDDRGDPTVQHVRVRVRYVANLESIDPRRLPGYPSTQAEREPWLVLNAPKGVLVAEYSAGGRLDPITNLPIGDDPRYFITFSPAPMPDSSGVPSAPNENISPFAGAVLRFTKPVNLTTVKAADTFFVATRNVLDQAAIDGFVATVPWSTASFETPAANGIGMDPASFNADKFRTPHLIAARVYDEDGSQTALRLQPTMGFYLDDRMRNPQPGEDFSYYLHLVAGATGVRDLSGNAVDLQADTLERAEHLVIPFTLDTRMNGTRPTFENNLAISIVRRFGALDEDENPSYYMPTEVQPPRDQYQSARPTAYPVQDIFGAVVFLDGQLQARPSTRVRKIGDNLNQAPVASQDSPLRWCPVDVGGEPQVSSGSAVTPFTQGGIQNPLNPYGCRLQTVWREVDLSLSRVDPYDFDLDVEQMYWAPFVGSAITFDELDRVSLYVGHSEKRPLPCVGNFSALPTFVDSGLGNVFSANYVHNNRANATGVDTQPLPFPAYVDVPMTIDPAQAVLEPNRVNRYLPLPTFQKPYFVYRDQTVIEQGGVSGLGSDITNNLGGYAPHLLSPYGGGIGRRVARGDWALPATAPGSSPQALTMLSAWWNDEQNYKLNNRTTLDTYTDGLVGNVALPLLADFWTYCDSPDLPAGNGYIALGVNGWQISITVQSSPQPNFRAFSAGRAPSNGSPMICIGPGNNDWNNSMGGYTPPPQSARTPGQDNSFYWIMIDFLKRATVATNGFVDLINPHRIGYTANTAGPTDPRLGPYLLERNAGNNYAMPELFPVGVLPTFAYEFDPPLSTLPGGTSVVPQFRAAGLVDSAPWYWQEWVNVGNLYSGGNNTAMRALLQPTADNFPLDPAKAGDAHIRKFDDRNVPNTTTARNWWTYFYNRTVTDYVDDPNQLMDPAQVLRYGSPSQGFSPRDIRYLNWRLLMSNNTAANPAVAPAIQTFSLSYRFQRSR